MATQAGTHPGRGHGAPPGHSHHSHQQPVQTPPFPCAIQHDMTRVVAALRPNLGNYYNKENDHQNDGSPSKITAVSAPLFPVTDPAKKIALPAVNDLAGSQPMTDPLPAFRPRAAPSRPLALDAHQEWPSRESPHRSLS